MSLLMVLALLGSAAVRIDPRPPPLGGSARRHAPQVALVAVDGAAPCALGGSEAAASGGSEMEARWDRLRSRPFRRYVALNSFMVHAAVKIVRANRTDDDELTIETAGWVRDGLLRLGPTMIKLGQVFSTRTDLLHPEYVRALSTLQTEVPAVPAAGVRAQIEAELGRPLADVFDSFEDAPIAGASLGQVHRATLRGRPVAVKVQRPGLRSLFDTDFASIRLIAKLVDRAEEWRKRAAKWLGRGQAVGAGRDWMRYCDDAARLLYEEIDYVHEGRNAEAFSASMPASSHVLVPEVLWEATTARVLTMEFIPSVKLTDAEGLARLGLDHALLQRRVTDCFMRQLLETGVLHCDPHPGNMCAASDPRQRNKLVMYDFGMMDTLPEDVRLGLRKAALSLFGGPPIPTEQQLSEAADELMKALTLCGFLAEGADAPKVRKVGRYLIGAFKAGRGGRPAGDVTQAVGAELQSLLDSGAIGFPSAFTFVARAFASVDGICRSLVPSYAFADSIDPYVGKLIAADFQDRGASWREGLRALLMEPLAAPTRLAEADAALAELRDDAADKAERCRRAEIDAASLLKSLEFSRAVAVASLGLNAAIALALALRRIALL